MDPVLLARVRTLVTLSVLVALLLVASAWAWSQLTEPFPTVEEVAVCEDRTVAPGDTIRPDDLTVSVLNAGDRTGLAESVLDALLIRGFSAGDLENAPPDTKVGSVEIWTDEPKSPAVRLVATYLGEQVKIVDRAPPSPGINVVVGDGFDRVLKGRKRIVPRQAVTICSPTAPVVDPLAPPTSTAG